MNIGLLAKRSGRSIHTLRYYEAQRLMPNVSRDEGGRRTYTDRHVAWLDFLGRLRQSGMSIADMRTYTALVARGDTTLAQRRAFLGSHRKRVALAIQDLRKSLAQIDQKIALYGRWIEAGGRPPTMRASR
jgi:DNA-binding transcriptional MerR regulator